MAFSPSTYTRRIELLDTDASTVLAVLSDTSGNGSLDVVESAEFTLLRQGGCGAGNFKLAQDFLSTTVQMGQFIRCRHGTALAPLYFYCV